MAHTFAHLLTHIIFSTKGRRPLLDPELCNRLYPYLGGLFRECGATMLERNATADHIHILASLPQDKSVSEIMRITKTNSSRWIHETWPDKKLFAWQIGFGAFSVSESDRDRVCSYIAGQQEKHRTVSFEEEFIGFLEKHKIQYDPKYLWV